VAPAQQESSLVGAQRRGIAMASMPGRRVYEVDADTRAGVARVAAHRHDFATVLPNDESRVGGRIEP